MKKPNQKTIIKVILLLLLAIYVISPIDLIPDVIPVIGWIDDAAAVVGVFYYLTKDR